MPLDDYFELGYISKIHGIKGEMVLILDTDFPENYNEMESVFIRPKAGGEELVPFFVESISITGSKALIGLEEINSPEKAKELIGSSVFLPLDNLPDPGEGEFYLHELIGLQIHDQNQGDLGKIEDIYNLPGQDVISMTYKGKEVLIPLSTETVLDIDREQGVVYTAIPEGLLDIYLS